MKKGWTKLKKIISIIMLINLVALTPDYSFFTAYAGTIGEPESQTESVTGNGEAADEAKPGEGTVSPAVSGNNAVVSDPASADDSVNGSDNGVPGENQTEGPADALSGDAPDAEDGADNGILPADTGNDTKGDIMFQIHWNDETDTSAGRYFDWSETTRPAEVPADPNSVVTLWKYKESEPGVPDEDTVEQVILQNGDISADNFCKITITEGEPYWSVAIGNVVMPEGYHFFAKGPGQTSYLETAAAYEKPEDEQTGNELKIGYVEYELNYQPLTISKKVVPSDAEPVFDFNVKVTDAKASYKGTYAIGDDQKTTANGTVQGVHDGQAAVILQIPVGVSYEVTEAATDGYITVYDDETTSGVILEDGSCATEVTNICNNVKVTLHKVWNDNNDPDRDEQAFIDALKFEYKLGDGEWTDFTRSAAEELGISFSYSKDKVDYSIEKTGSNTWTAQALHGNGAEADFPAAVINDDGTFTLISYRITEGDLEGYTTRIETDEDGNTVVNNIKAEDFNATIYWRDLSERSHRPEEVKIDIVAYYLDENNVKHEATEEELELMGLKSSYTVKTDSGEEDPDTTRFTIPDLPMYTREGYPITYYAKQEVLQEYSTTYDNTETDYGTVEIQCHNGGTILNLRRDNTTFSANKKWVDAGNNDEANRPAAKVYLYRYVPAAGQTEEEASPVAELDQDGKTHIISMDTPGGINEEAVISFDDIMADIDADEGGHKLWKYDAYGREYTYIVKEVLTKSGSSLEYSKTYYDKDGNQTNYLYDGGTLVNSRIPKADLRVEKSWIAAAFPDAAAGTEVTMKVKVSEDGGASWSYLKDDKGKDIEITVSGFSQDCLTVGETVTVPMYSISGTALQYQTEEISVKKGGNEIFDKETETTAANGHTFKLANGTIDMADVDEPEDLTKNAEVNLTCRNILADDADIIIKKRWDGVTAEDTYVVNVRIDRYLYTGAKDESFVPVTAEIKGKEGFEGVAAGLPLFDEQGYPYEYRTTELGVSDGDEEVPKEWGVIYDYNYDYENKKITATVTNYKGGSGTHVSVHKIWLDDGCVEDRLPVVAQAYDADGNIWNGKFIFLSESNGWEGKIYFSAEEMQTEKFTNGFTIRESKVGEYYVDYNGETEDFEEYKNDEGTLGVAVTDPDEGYVFLVNNTVKPDGSIEITNRRIGKVFIRVEKHWVDNGRDNAERPSISANIYRDGELIVENHTIGPDDVTLIDNNTWEYIYGVDDALSKYDETGRQYTYAVKELDTSELKADDYVNKAEIGSYDTTAAQYHSGDVQNYILTNKREGETSFKVHKIWSDIQGQTERPDIRVELYYSLGDGETYPYGTGPASDVMSDPIDYVWEQSPEEAAHDTECTVPVLPEYAGNGARIEYFCKEVMNTPEDYKAYYWKDEQMTEESTAFCGEQPLAGNGEYIENRLEAKIHLNGTKLWMGMQNGTKAEDLDTSGIHINLYRYAGERPDDLLTNPVYLVDTASLSQSEGSKNRKFLFEDVDKYDENGHKYSFELHETIDGKLGYVYNNDPNGFRITNTFVTGPENNRVIQVNKDWDSKKYTDNIKAGQEFEYPDAVFKLYRSAGKSAADNEIDLNGEPIATLTLSPARGQSSGTMVFPAQLIWSEYGVQYKYAVVEVVDGVPSYQIPAEKQTVYISDKDRNGNDVTYTPDNKPGVRTAHFENTYVPKTGFSDLRLSGAKYWKDANGAHRPDPTNLVLNVYRSAPGTALSTAMPEVKLTYGTDYTIRWQTTTYENCWYYTIQGDAITELAPNGQRFVYRITEEVPEGYKVSGGASQQGDVNNAKNQRMTDMTNTLTGTYNVSKRWDDNNNEYALRPVSVIVVLQRSNDNGANWEYVTAKNNTEDELYDVPGETGVKALSVELNAGNKWKYTFENLDPTYIYRAEEVAAGVKEGTGVDKTIYPYWKNTDEGGRHMIGSYNISYDYSDTQTTVTNKLDPTTLSVTKIWAGDNNNYYDSRPLNDAGIPTVTVKIQRKYWNEDDGEDDANWKDVVNTNGKPVTMVLSSTDKSHTWEYGNLPKCDYLGRNYEYRAVEITDNVQGYEAAHESGNLNQIFIQNKLIERTLSISVEKKWSEGAVDSHYPVVIELTRWVPSGQDPDIQVPYPQPMTITLDGTADDMTNAVAGESSAWVATWNNLPLKDNAGYDYIYKVEEISINGTPVENKKAAGYLVDNGADNDQLIVWPLDSKVEIRNTLAMEYKVSKEFKNDTYADRPTSVTVQLQRTTATTINDSTSWEDVGDETVITGFTDTVSKKEYTFKDLPKFDEDNNQYTYRAVETKIGNQTVTDNFTSGYDVTYEDANTDATHYGAAITNTMRTINIQGTKEWDDQDDFYQMRPSDVTVKLYKNTADPQIVSKQPDAVWTKPEGNTWTYNFSGLPQYDADGSRIEYMVCEVYKSGSSWVVAGDIDDADGEYPLMSDNGINTGYVVSNNYRTGSFDTAAAESTVIVDNGAGIKNKLEVVDVEGTKTWAGESVNGTAVEIRPGSISVSLKNGNKSITVPETSYTPASESNNWTYKFVNVPKYDKNGAVITYTVEETKVPGYTESRDENNDKLITNTLDKKTLTATKVWVDQNNKYSTRPDDWDNTDGTGIFTVYADYGDGNGYVEMTDQPECTWTGVGTNTGKYTFKAVNLQKYNLVAGKEVEILYKVQEDEVPKAYTSKASTDGKTITNTLDVSSIAVTKNWVDNNNYYKTRPNNLTLTLKWKRTVDADWSNVTPAPSVSWTKSGSTWTYTFADLPDKDVDGNEYSYKVIETVPTGYYTAADADSVEAVISDGTGSVEFTNTLYTVNVEGTKTWDDQDNFYQMRPSDVTVKLYNGNTQVAIQPDAVWTKPEGNTWTFKFSGLPMYDAAGNRISYSAKEVGTIAGYEVSNNNLTGDFSAATDKSTVHVAGDGKGIENKLKVVTITGTKTWACDTDDDINGTRKETRPASINVALMNGNTKVTVPDTSYTAAAADGAQAWTYTFKDVPEYNSNNRKITYTVEETPVPCYTASYDSTHKLITNNLDTVDLTATKVWVDQNDRYSTRPAGWNNTDGTGLFTVYADYGDGNGSQAMTEQPECKWEETSVNSGTYTFTAENLQKYNLVGGKAVEIRYEIREEMTTNGYTTTVSDDGKTFTNTLDVSTINVTKNWVDNSDAYRTRPDDLTLTLLWKKTGQTDWSSVTPAPEVNWNKNGNTWTCSFAMPNKDVNGNEYSYKVDETIPAGYHADVTEITPVISEGTGTAEFTNTFDHGYVQIDKVFADTGDNGDLEKPLATFVIENEAKSISFAVSTDETGAFAIDSSDGSYTGTDGKKFWLIPGKYTLTEVSSETLADGCRFAVDTNSYEFTVQADKTVTVANETSNGKKLFRNTPVRGTLTLTKMDEKYIMVNNKLVEKTDKGQLLGDAEFNICLDEAGTQVVASLVPVKDNSGNIPAGLYTLPAGTQSTLTNDLNLPYLRDGKLLCGTYYIIETGVPEGYYVKDSQSPKQIIIGADNNAQIVDVTPEMENTLIEQPFKIAKYFEVPNRTSVNEDGKKIWEQGTFLTADADNVFSFIIERSSDSKPEFEYTATVSTDENGVADFGNIPYGEYTVREWVDTIYNENTEFTITVDDNGVTLNGEVLNDGQTQVHNTLWRNAIEGWVVDKEHPLIKLENAIVGLYDNGECIAKTVTDDNGYYIFENIPGGSYQVAEIKSPENYVLDDTPKDASIYQGAGTTVRQVADIENEPVKIALTLHKVDNETGAAMKDVEFALTGTDFRGNAVEMTGATKADGSLTFENITVGQSAYNLAETKVTDYEAPHTFKLTVTNVEDGNSNKAAAALVDTSAGEGTDSLAAANDDGSYTITNIRIRKDFSFVKKGTDDETDLTHASVLSGAKFGLYDNETASGEALQIAESNVNGLVTFTKIPCGTWYAKEISAPANYTADDTIYKITVAQDGSVTSSLTEVVNEAIRGKIEFTKVDKDHHDIKIPGAQYSLAKKGASGEYETIALATSDAGGKVVFENLLIGTDYRVTETGTVTNYLLADSSADFVLKLEDGKAVTELKAADNTPVEATDSKMLWNEKPVVKQFKIKKDYEIPNAAAYDAEGAKIGEEGEYAAADADNSFTFTIERTVESTPAFTYTLAKTTDADGIADFGDIPYGTYTVTETAVDDYVENEVFTITVSEDGIKRGSTALTDGVTQVHNTLKRGSISGTVIDAEYADILLKGAEVGLYNKDNVLVAKVTTGEDGSYKFENIPYGDYTVKEVKAPENYLINNDPISVSIENNEENKELNAIPDQPVKISVTLHKVDNETGDPLADVEFTLAGTDFRGNAVEMTGATKADGSLTFENITVGQSAYNLAETKVTDYEAPHTFKLTVTNVEDGNSNKAAAALVDTSAGEGTDSLAAANDDGSYTITNIRIRKDFSFVKKGTDDETDLTHASVLSGAKFGLYDNETASGEALQIAESNVNGLVTFTKIPCGTWYAKEISAPANYTADDTIYKITVAQDGSVTSSLTEVVNEAIRGKIEFTKVDKDHHDIKIPGAQYSLAKKGTSGEYETIALATSDAGGKVVFENLLIGTDYRVTETGTVTNYLLADSSADFVLKLEDGKAVTELKAADNTPVEVTDSKMLWNEKPVVKQFKIKKDYEIPNAAAFDAEGAKIGEEGEYAAADADNSFTFTIERTVESTPAFTYTLAKTTDADGIADFGDIPYGTYTVTETAVDDYVENEVFTITVSEDGIKRGSTALTDGVTQVHNTLKRGSISGTVIDAEYADILLKGAEVGLYNKDNVLVAKVTTGEDGSYKFENIPYGDYTVKEVKAPENYLINNDPISVSIENNEENKELNAIPDQPVKISVTLHKVDNETGDPLADVEFTLAGTDFRGKAVNETLTTDENGNLEFAPVPVGGYTVSEVKVDDYEEPLDFVISVTNQEAGNSNTAVVSILEDEDADAVDTVFTTENGKLTVVNIRLRRDFSFSKVGTDSEIDMTKNTSLAGAVFGLYDNEEADGEPVQIVESDENGVVTFTQIPCGDWFVKEISAPDNFELDEGIYKVTVNQDGSVTSDLEIVVNEAIRGSIKLTNVDMNDHDHTISGTQYVLYRKDAETGEYKELLTLETDENGNVEFPNLLIGVEYRIEEISAADGYQVSKQTADFILELEDMAAVTKLLASDDGTVEVNEDGDMLWNQPPTVVEIAKVDQKEAMLEGAEFTLTDENGQPVTDKDGKVIKWTSSKDGSYRIEGVLAAGKTYTLTETKAPDGYKKMDPVTFTVESVKSGPTDIYVQEIKAVNELLPAPTGNTDNVNTGDASRMFLWSMLLAGSYVVLTGIFFKERKRRKASGKK